MNTKHTVLHILNYSLIYRGNFIDSLEYLNELLTADGGRNIYLFNNPSASKRDWIQELIADGRSVYFLSSSFMSDLSLIRSVISKENVGFVHTHFVTSQAVDPRRFGHIRA